jgi:hypothetical protein
MEPSESTLRMIGRTQAERRAVNERLILDAIGGAAIRIGCECALIGCDVDVTLAGADYRRVREHPVRFVVAPTHVIPEAERVVEQDEDYVVVEKFSGPATDGVREVV